jgi:Mn-containing catalase
MSNGQEIRGPWNDGVSPELGETWQYIDDPIAHVATTNGLLDQEIAGTERTETTVSKLDKELSKERSSEVMAATPTGENQWSTYEASGASEFRTPGNESSTSERKRPGTATSKAKTSARKSK